MSIYTGGEAWSPAPPFIAFVNAQGAYYSQGLSYLKVMKSRPYITTWKIHIIYENFKIYSFPEYWLPKFIALL